MFFLFSSLGKGGKNRRRGKNENESEKRELVFKEDGQGNVFITGRSPPWNPGCVCLDWDIHKASESQTAVQQHHTE